MADLKRIMDLISGRTIDRRIRIRIKKALQRYRMPRTNVSSFSELHEEIADFAFDFLSEYFCEVNWSRESAYDYIMALMLTSGIDPRQYYYDCLERDGLFRLFQDTAEALEKQQVQTYLETTFQRELNVMDGEELQELMSQYVAEYGRHLPFELRNMSTLLHEWRSVLMSHAQTLDIARSRVGRF